MLLCCGSCCPGQAVVVLLLNALISPPHRCPSTVGGAACDPAAAHHSSAAAEVGQGHQQHCTGGGSACDTHARPAYVLVQPRWHAYPCAARHQLEHGYSIRCVVNFTADAQLMDLALHPPSENEFPASNLLEQVALLQSQVAAPLAPWRPGAATHLVLEAASMCARWEGPKSHRCVLAPRLLIAPR